MAKLNADHEKLLAKWAAISDRWVSDNREETLACQEMEACQEEKPTSLDRKPEAAEQRDILVEDAEVIQVGEPKKRRGDRKLATERRRQKPKKLSR